MRAKSFSRAAERRLERKQQILDVSSQLFSEQGYENVTLRAIAEKLGYSHAAFYRYFPDKASLLAEICRDTFDRLIIELDSQQNQVQGPEAQLLALSLGFIRFGLRHPHHFRVVFSGPEKYSVKGANDHIAAIGSPVFERLMNSFLTCSAALGMNEETRMLDANTWWISLFGTTHILVTTCPVIGRASNDEVAQRYIETMWHGLQSVSGKALLLTDTKADPSR